MQRISGNQKLAVAYSPIIRYNMTYKLVYKYKKRRYTMIIASTIKSRINTNTSGFMQYCMELFSGEMKVLHLINKDDLSYVVMGFHNDLGWVNLSDTGCTGISSFEQFDQFSGLLGVQWQRWDAQCSAFGSMVSVGFQHGFLLSVKVKLKRLKRLSAHACRIDQAGRGVLDHLLGKRQLIRVCAFIGHTATIFLVH